jgi:hypothetical protein
VKVTTLREPARVEMHLDGGHTRVRLERMTGVGMAEQGTHWDIPTRRIPPELRAIGSRFVVVSLGIWPEPGDSVDALRAAARDAVTIEPLPHGQ